ncbi:unnamed protein product [Cochlearia groenlandica]
MEINCEKLGFDYRNVKWGFDDFGEDEFLNTMLYETSYWVSNNVDFSCFGVISDSNSLTVLPDDPFCMTLNSISDWLLHDNNHIGGLVSESHGHDQNRIFERLDCVGNTLEFDDYLPEDPFCMSVRSEFRDKPISVLQCIRFGDHDMCSYPSMFPHDAYNDDSDDSDDDDGDCRDEPREGFELVFPYLEMRDVLAVERVCRSLRDYVRKETFLWKTIDLTGSIPRGKVTDGVLLKLTSRAQGNLRCLNLGGCAEISDDCLRQVLSSNPSITKLGVARCHGLSTSGVLSILRDLKSTNRLGFKILITGGGLYFTKEQYQELNMLLGADAKAGQRSRKQRLYTSCRSDFSVAENQVTDLEICPWCEKPGLVFDCASETCTLKDHPCPKSSCRACIVCIERCHECGSCLNDCEDMPFCFNFICGACYKLRTNPPPQELP